ncbi:hypothetical protein RRF57_005020 [Xylaria bambusicola]|uniref:Peptidase S9 prolyl oligopeptidase catalytic domain-containing protein n=1 Tax=Xylaria bambusicola TaxID=326684 RepID=A0AAN7UBN2_9PEZI
MFERTQRFSAPDGTRVGIVGPSAGGYLTLQAICTEPDIFAGAVSVAGIADMARFAETTHKFECCYDRLLINGRGAPSLSEQDWIRRTDEGIGAHNKMDAPQALYATRSLIKHLRRLKTPVSLLQGGKDIVMIRD